MPGKHFDLDTDVLLGGENSSDITIASQKATKSYIDTKNSAKQDKLTAGQNIKIENNVISVDGISAELSELSDTTITNPTNGQGLLYNGTTEKWENKTIDIPSKTSDLTNDSGFITKSVNNLDNYTTTTDLNTALSGKADSEHEHTVSDITDFPTNVSVFTNDAGYLTEHQDITGKQDVIDASHKLSSDLVDDTDKTHKFVTSAEKTTWNNKQDAINDLADIRSGATAGSTALQPNDNVSKLTNDAGYLVASDISGKADASNVYTKTEIDGKLSGAMHFKGTVATVSALPATGNVQGDMYNVSETGANYAWDGSKWDKLSENVDLSGLQEKITSTNKLNADLVDDTSSTNKFVTSTEKSTWSGKQNAITSSNKLSADLLSEGTTNKLVSATEKSTWNAKQDSISDLADIRSNAAAGKNASDTIAEYGDVVSHDADEFAQVTHTHTISDVTNLQTTLNGKQNEITSTNKLSADLLSEGTNNKLVSATEKSTWNSKLDSSAIADMATQTWVGEQGYLTSHQDISGKQDKITSTNKLSADLLSEGTTNKLVSASEKSTWNGKQDALSATQISNIAKGGTAVQPGDLAEVATSGSYNDLTDKPSIPSAVTESTVSGWGFTKNTGTVTKVNNVSPVNGNVTIDIPTVPTNVSAFTNDAGYLTEHQDISGKADTADLSDVAFSGNYNDLENKPTIPTVNNATLTIQKNGSTVKTFTANASSNVTCNITVPTQPSDIGAAAATHDHTSSQITDLSTTISTAIAGKADSATSLSGYGITDAYTKTEIDGMVSAGMHYKGTKASASALPTTGNAVGDLWNVSDTGANYAWNGTAWDKLSENVDLSGYVPTSRTVNGKALTGNISLTAGDVGAAASSHSHSNYVPTTRTVNGKALSANITLSASDVGALSDDTVIPTKVSELTNDSGYTTNTGTITGIKMNGASKGTSGVVDLGTVLTAHQTVKVNGVTGATTNNFGTCSTAAATVAKTVTLTAGTFALETGARVLVKFTVTNTATNPTLNVGGTGAKAIQYRGSAISAGYLAANRTYEFVYDGTNYQLVGDINTDTNNVTAQNISTANDTYPILLGNTANATANIGNKATLFGSGIKANPSTSTIVATTFDGNATSATTASKLGTADKGSATQPIYLSAGVPTACTYTLAKSVPSDAKFTDTVYTHPTTAGNKHVPSGGSSNQVLVYGGSSGTASWGAVPSHTHAEYSNKDTMRSTEFIVGTQTATTGSWTGVTEDTTLYDGKNINYFLPYAGSGNASLNLTLSGGTTTGAKPIYLSGTSYVTTHYGANSCINMTYNATKGAWFVNADRDNNDVTRLQWSNNITAATAITADRVIVGTSSGYKNIAANTTFDITYPILYSKSAINAAATGTNNWQSEPSINLSNNKSGWTGTNLCVVYLVGTLDGTVFTIDSTMLTTTVPTSADNKVYTPLGVMYNTTNCYFRPTNEYYAYVNGKFQKLTYVHPTTSGNKHIPSGGSSGQFLKWSADGTATWAADNDTKNTAGSTDTSSKIFLVGATSQAANPQTYSHDTAFVDTNGRVNSAAPASDANDTTVATTKWVKDHSYVTTNTAQTISAVKTFSAEPLINSNIQFGNVSTGSRGIWGKVGDTDYWRVYGGATASNAGYMELATADDGNEPIYIRQYTGQFSTVTRTATLLNASGNTELPGSLSIGNGGATMQYNSTTEAIEFVFA